VTSATKHSSVHDAVAAVKRRPLAEVDAMIAALQLPSCLADYPRATNHMIDRGFLSFGRLYRLHKTLVANRLGTLVKGDVVRFLGASVFPYDNGLRIYFEYFEKPGEECVLEFEGNFPEADDCLRMLETGKEGAYFTPYSSVGSADTRSIDLLDAERLLRQSALETAQLADQAYKDAQPHYQKKLLEIQEKHKVYGPGVNAVFGDEGSRSIQEPMLDYGTLQFGKTYLVRQNAAANRSGRLEVGTRVFFLGAETRFGEEVTLAFQLENGTSTDLVFYPTREQDAQACQPMLHPDAFFIEVFEGLTPRGLQLRQIRDTFLDLIKERDAANE